MTNHLVYRIEKLERQVQDLLGLLDCYGMPLYKCTICGKILRKYLYCDTELSWLNGIGIEAVLLRDGRDQRFYCLEHFPEAYEDIGEWVELDRERAEYALASWLVHHPTNRTPVATLALSQYPRIKEKIGHLQELEQEKKDAHRRADSGMER